MDFNENGFKFSDDENFEQEENNSLEEKEDNIDLNAFLNGDEDSDKSTDKKSKFKFKFNFNSKIKKGAVLKVVLSVFLVGIITACIIAGAFIVYAFNFVDASMNENLYDLANLEFSTTIYYEDSEGNWVEDARLHGEFNRIWASDAQGEIPENLKNAFIAIEDERFRTHTGVDWKRTFSAFANLFLHFYSSNQGGSTITQQLVKNLTGDNSTSPSRKVREIMRARELEINFSKDVILECYINTVAMGGGLYGSEVAANYYFGKSTKDLTLNECAALAAIVKEPEGYRPDKKPERNTQRRQTVLNKMLELGFITQEEHDAVYFEELEIVANPNIKNNGQKVNSYFVDALYEDVVKGLMDTYGYDEQHAKLNFYNGGYKIYSTMSKDVQNALEEVFTDTQYAYEGKDGKLMQGSMVVMDYKGNIKGMVGGIGEKTGNRVFNRATSAYRQPGSTIKPLSAYTPAIEGNLITYSSIVSDTDSYEYKNNDDTMWKPRNWYNNGGYLGNITVEKALERSTNTIPTMLVEKLTLPKVFDYLTGMFGLDSLNNHDVTSYASLGMGGTNVGVTTMQEAAAYATFGNGGIYYKPTTYYKVTDQRDQVILEVAPDPIVAMSDDTATVMNHLLRNVVDGPQGTGAEARKYITHLPVYAKTGTSNDDMNCWFTGGTPYYVASTWCGYDTLQKVTPNTVAKTMWGRVMGKIHSNLPSKEFTDSAYSASHLFCTETGLLAREGCTSVRMGWYRKSNLPDLCTTHEGEKAEIKTEEENLENSETTQTPDSPDNSAPAGDVPAETQ